MGGASKEPMHPAVRIIPVVGPTGVRFSGFLRDLESAKLADSVATLRKGLLVLHSPFDDVVGIENASEIFLAAKHPKSFVCSSRNSASACSKSPGAARSTARSSRRSSSGPPGRVREHPAVRPDRPPSRPPPMALRIPIRREVRGPSNEAACPRNLAGFPFPGRKIPCPPGRRSLCQGPGKSRRRWPGLAVLRSATRRDGPESG